ncbi:hypothetical protein AB9E34_33200, partial [Rhizobium leguminosarum]|uniref:hypothetical protein n=1 Tax=Rhizobium leguminosarum TaxID=384 RepID=UPI003F9BC8BC
LQERVVSFLPFWVEKFCGDTPLLRKTFNLILFFRSVITPPFPFQPPPDPAGTSPGVTARHMHPHITQGISAHARMNGPQPDPNNTDAILE